MSERARTIKEVDALIHGSRGQHLPRVERRPPEHRVQIQGYHIDVFHSLELLFGPGQLCDLAVHGQADGVVGVVPGRGLYGAGVPGRQRHLAPDNVQKNDVTVPEMKREIESGKSLDNKDLYRGRAPKVEHPFTA